MEAGWRIRPSRARAGSGEPGRGHAGRWPGWVASPGQAEPGRPASSRCAREAASEGEGGVAGPNAGERAVGPAPDDGRPA